MVESRPDWDDYFLSIAQLASTRSTCLSRKVGAVAVKDKRILATGYNGAVSGSPHCDEVGCLRKGSASGTNLHQCRAIHGETNVVAQAARFGTPLDGSTVYVTCQPCASCFKLLAQAGAVRIVWKESYPDSLMTQLAKECGWQECANEVFKEEMFDERV